MRKRILGILCAAMTAVCMTTTVFAEFSSIEVELGAGGALNGVNGWEAENVVTAADPDGDENLTVKLDGEATMSKSFEAPDGTFIVSIDAYMASLNTNDLSFAVLNDDTAVASAVLNNGTVTFNGKTASYTAGNWFGVTYLVEDDTISLYVDRVLIGSVSGSGADEIKITGSDEVYFDNFKVATQNATIVESADPADWATAKVNDVFNNFEEEAETIIAGTTSSTGTLTNSHNWYVASTADNSKDGIYAQLYADSKQTSNFAYTNGSNTSSADANTKFMMIRNQAKSDSYHRVYRCITNSGTSNLSEFEGKAIYTAKINIFNGANKYYLDLRGAKGQATAAQLSDPGRQVARLVFDYTSNSDTGTIYAEYDASTNTKAELNTVDLGTFVPGTKTNRSIEKAWMDVAIIADSTSRTYDVYINGEKKNTDKIPFYYREDRMNGNASVTATAVSYISFEAADKANSKAGRIYVESVGMFTDEKLLYSNFTDTATENFDSLKKPAYESVILENNNGEVKLTVNKTAGAVIEDASAYIAVYDKDFRFKTVRIFDMSEKNYEGEYTVNDFELSDTDVLKAFIWDSSLTPLTTVVK